MAKSYVVGPKFTTRIPETARTTCCVTTAASSIPRSSTALTTRGPRARDWRFYVALNMEHFSYGEGLGISMSPGIPHPNLDDGNPARSDVGRGENVRVPSAVCQRCVKRTLGGAEARASRTKPWKPSASTSLHFCT